MVILNSVFRIESGYKTCPAVFISYFLLNFLKPLFINIYIFYWPHVHSPEIPVLDVQYFIIFRILCKQARKMFEIAF